MSNKSEIFVVQWLKTSTTSSKLKQSWQSILANLGLWLASVYLSTTTPWCFSWSSQPLDLELKPEKIWCAALFTGNIEWMFFCNGTGTFHWNLVDSFQLKLSYMSSYMAIHPCVKWRDMAWPRYITLPILIPQPKVLLFFSTHLALDSSSQSLFNYSGVSSNMVQVRNKMGRCMIHWMVIEVLYYYILSITSINFKLWVVVWYTKT